MFSNRDPSKSRSRLSFFRRSLSSMCPQPVWNIFWSKEGHHFGWLCATCVIASVLTISIVLTVSAVGRYGVIGGLGTIQNGACSKTKNPGMWLHLLVSALSTLLLGASNRAMQCLSAPVREEITKLIAETFGWTWEYQVYVICRTSLDRGIVRWVLVPASSISLHLLSNSAVFSDLSAPKFLSLHRHKRFPHWSSL